MEFDLQPTLQGKLIELHPLRSEDFAALFAAASDPLIWEQHPERDRYTREVFQRYFDGAIEFVEGNAEAGIGLGQDATDNVVMGNTARLSLDGIYVYSNARRNVLGVNITITTLDEKLARLLEPRANDRVRRVLRRDAARPLAARVLSPAREDPERLRLGVGVPELRALPGRQGHGFGGQRHCESDHLRHDAEGVKRGSGPIAYLPV